MRVVFFCLMAWCATTSFASELRWSFDSLPADARQGDAKLEPIGPTSDHFVGLPETNSALRLDGNGDYVRVPDNAQHGSLDFVQGESISMEAWVRLDQIGNGQNVYIVGKGRTHKDGPRENQNYALRLRSVSGDARVSFLFRSAEGAADEDGKSQWHRWTTNRGFRPDGSWHHVAVTYRFGKPESVRGYVDGKSIGGKWDMGGATTRAPMVDDDDLWIGSSMGGAAGSSLRGAIDEVVIQRRIVPAEDFASRRIVITRPPKAPSGALVSGRVNVSIYENVGSNAAWPIQLPEPMVQFTQSAFGISRIPLPYGSGGVRRDWKGPSLLVAMAEVDLPDESIQWMVRAGGLSRLWVGDQMVVETPPHLGPSNGHGEVVPYTEPDPWLRPLRAGHHQKTATHRHEKPTAVIALETMIGGDGLRYEPGEIVVAYRVDPADDWQVLSLGESIALTDQQWRPYAARHDAAIQQVDDRHRRMAASGDDEYWEKRHREARRFIADLPPLGDGRTAETGSAGSIVDHFIQARLEAVDQSDQLAPPTSDDQFLRRLMLDCVGVIPSPAEIQEFRSLAEDSALRRSRMIDRVLEDPRWADHWTAYWMDVLAENASVLKPSLNNSGPFRWYLYDMMRDNVPVDRWVTGLLRMEGSVLHGGAAGFAMASDNDVPMAAKAHVATSAFLGANMKCARCHDAPYHDWTQRDLFALAAMLERKPIEVPKSSSVPKEFFAGEETGESLITLSVAPGEKVPPAWSLSPYTHTSAINPDDLVRANDSREEFAYQVTRVENRQFAMTIVNRLWQRLMGEGIVEPVDDWEGADPSHPQLLDYLARELASHDFDFKHVARLILNSQAYQRQAIDRPVERDETRRLFAAPRARRMTAEQLVDSLHAVVGRAMDAGELTFDPEARMKPTAQNNLGLPRRAWQLTSLSNERDRPALSLPRAAAVAECMEAFGWTGSRQEPINHRQVEANVIQPGILAGGLMSIQLTRLTDQDELTSRVIDAESVETLVEELFQRFLTRSPTDAERERFVALLRPGFDTRVLSTPMLAVTPIREPAVSWANHLHPQATEVRLREAERLRHGPPPSRWLETDWRQRMEDAVWALINTPEFLFIP